MKIGYQIGLDGIEAGGFFGTAAPCEELNLPEYPGCVLRLVSEPDGKTGICRRRLEVINKSSKEFTLKFAHIRYELPYPSLHLSYFSSSWGSEYNPVEADITYPITIGSWSGRSSKGCSPFFRVSRTWNEAGMLGISVGWSGAWQADIDCNGQASSVSAGLAKKDFFHTLKAGETFTNIDIYDGEDAGEDPEDLSFRFRTYYKNNIRILSESSAAREIPVIYNHWWPYEDRWINEDVFFENAKIAGEMGFTNAMLDAGWFGPSDGPDKLYSMAWYQKRGDWEDINTALFPSGLKALGQKVNGEAGIPFGIWCEIEAVGAQAKLRKKRPDLMAVKNGKQLDYVCMGNPKAGEWALDIFKRLVEEYGAKWIKIDFNLDPVSCDCVEHGHGPGDGLYAHYRGLYAFMDEVRRRYPYLVIENCSSGGLRADYGIMKHCHYLYLSDPDFTRHHLQCFWGALSHFHPSACYHFTQSETVNGHNFAWDEKDTRHSVYRPIAEFASVTHLDYMTRACMSGVMGLSQKLPELPEWARIRLKEHIAFYRSISGDFILRGDIHRLTGQTRSAKGSGDAWCAFQLAADKNRSIVFVFKSDGGGQETNIKLKSLEPDKLYEVRFDSGSTPTRMTGRGLMENGLRFSTTKREWSEIVTVKSV